MRGHFLFHNLSLNSRMQSGAVLSEIYQCCKYRYNSSYPIIFKLIWHYFFILKKKNLLIIKGQGFNFVGVEKFRQREHETSFYNQSGEEIDRMKINQKHIQVRNISFQNFVFLWCSKFSTHDWKKYFLFILTTQSRSS